jgi:hypothetical protein
MIERKAQVWRSSMKSIWLRHHPIVDQHFRFEFVGVHDLPSHTFNRCLICLIAFRLAYTGRRSGGGLKWIGANETESAQAQIEIYVVYAISSIL